MVNTNNFAQRTNYMAGSDKLQLLPFYLASVNIPGMNLNHPELGGRTGGRLNLTGDTITYNSLSLEVLLDEDFEIFHEFTDKVFENIDPKSGTFADLTFDFWIEISNSKGNKLFKMEFNNCRVETIGDIQLDTQDDTTEFLLSLEFKFDYYEIIRSNIVPTLQT